ncbi:MAG: DNA alkylation repair protein [Lentisphaerae bacterium]|nr:DNA alkylation repair protein [Lentisphaerota bacterium]
MAHVLKGMVPTGMDSGRAHALAVAVSSPGSSRQVCLAAALDDTRVLLQSPWHEERLLAFLIMVRRFKAGDEATQRALYNAYLAETARINSWDLVDLSAPQIVGGGS